MYDLQASHSVAGPFIQRRNARIGVVLPGERARHESEETKGHPPTRSQEEAGLGFEADREQQVTARGNAGGLASQGRQERLVQSLTRVI